MNLSLSRVCFFTRIFLKERCGRMLKKLILSIAAFVIFANFSHAGEIVMSYRYENPVIKHQGNFSTIEFGNTMLTGKHGEPLLPYQSINALLPFGEEAVSFEIECKNEVFLKNVFKVFPKQYSKPVSQADSPDFLYNESIYNSNSIYPSDNKGKITTHYLNGYAIAMTSFTPIRFNPAKGTLSYYSNVKVTIKTRPSSKSSAATAFLRSDFNTLQRLNALIQNPKDLAAYPIQKNNNNYDLLIITNDAFVNSFSQLATMYVNRGLRTQVVNVNTINAQMNGADAPEKIRNYIIQEYQQQGINYVMLAGDVEHVPFRGFYCSVQSSSVYTDNNIPSDLYYSALDGNWNTDGDNLWGEIGEDDLLPDIAVARLPFSNGSELTNMLNKVIQYQTNPVLGELKKPLLAAEHLYDNPATWGQQYLRLLIGLKSDNGYNTNGIPTNHNIDSLYDTPSYTWNKTTLLNKINQGFSFIHHVGHANSDYVAKMYNSDITNTNFAHVNGTNHNYTLFYTHGCICGSFDNNDCIGEEMLKIQNFLAAFVGNSRYGWFNEGQTEGPSAHLHREFVHALYGMQTPRIGDAHVISKIRTAPWVNAPGQWEEGALRWCFYDCNVLSDPALSIWTYEPFTVNVTYDTSIVIGMQQIQVSVDTNGIAMPNYRCTIVKDENIIGAAYTDSLGNAMIQLEEPIAQPCQLNLKVSGYNIFPQTYNVSVNSSPTAYIHVNKVLVNDGNNNIPEYAEELFLNLQLKNFGLAASGNLSLNLTTQNAYSTILQNACNYNAIASLDSATILNAFQISIADNTPDQYAIPFQLTINDGKSQWQQNFSIIANSPQLSSNFHMLNDAPGMPVFATTPASSAFVDTPYFYGISIVASNGNNNMVLDPGETTIVKVLVNNDGHADINNVVCQVATSNAHVTLNCAQQVIGILNQGGSAVIEFPVTILSNAAIGEVVTLEFSIIGGAYQYSFSKNLTIGQIFEGFESGNFTAIPWVNDPTYPWTITSQNPFAGSKAAQSADIDHSQQSNLQIDFNVAINDTISFYKKVSSESSWDYLRFFIDGTEKNKWSGEADWSQEKFVVTPGTHTFKWSYTKDGSQSNGSDCAWLDDIKFPAGSFVSEKIINSLTITCPIMPAWLNFIDNGNGSANLSGTPLSQHVGNHQVKIIADNGSGNITNQEFIVAVGFVNVADKIGLQQLVLYPNPAKGSFNLLMSAAGSETMQIKLVNHLGQMVHDYGKLSTTEGANVISLRTGNHEGYFILLVEMKQQTYRLPLLIEK